MLHDHPAVQEAVVLVRGNEAGENSLVAYVVPKPQHVVTGRDLRHFLHEKLPKYMVPSLWVLLNALPRTPNGKVDRSALPAPDRTSPELEEAAALSRDSLELRLVEMWERLLGIRPIGVNDDFFDLGGSSLLAARLFAEIEKAWGRKLPLATLMHAPTVERLAGILRQEGASARWSSLVEIQSGGSRPPLFCVHGIGGNVLSYRELARHLGPDQPVYGLQARSLDGEQPGHARVEEMAAHYIQEIRSVQPEGPYLLGGLSFGGLVAFEMARQLCTRGQKIALLALFDTMGPVHTQPFLQKIRRDVAIVRRSRGRERLVYILVKARAIRVGCALRIFRVLYSAYRRLGHPSPRILRTAEQFNREAMRAYRPQVYSGRMTLFLADEQPMGYDDPQLGWGGLAAGGLEIQTVPGTHESLVQEPHVRVLAAKLRACLCRANASILDSQTQAW